jgi:hypothetical protein
MAKVIGEAREFDEALQALAGSELQRLSQQPSIDVFFVQIADVVH